MEHLPPLDDSTEGLVYMGTLLLADSQRSAVHEADARTLAQQYFLDEQCQRDGNFLLLLHEAVIGHQMWEEVEKIPATRWQN